MAITNIANQLSQQYMLKALREMMTESQRQSSTGKKSTTIANLGASGASTSITFRSKQNLLDAYTTNLNVAKTRMAVMDSSLSYITDSARDLLSQLRSQLQDTTPNATILSNTAKTSMQAVVDKMNTQINGRYLFSGSSIDDKAFTNLAALNTSVGAAVTTAITDPTTTAASFSATAGALNSASLGFNNAVVTSGSVNMLGGENVSVDYTVRASDGGFQDIMRGMAIIANLPQPTNDTEKNAYWQMVNSAISLLDNGSKAVDGYQGLLGNKAENVADLLTQHSATKTVYEEFIGDVEDVDMADAATRFSTLQTQLETSYSIIAKLKDLSLINYL